MNQNHKRSSMGIALLGTIAAGIAGAVAATGYAKGRSLRAQALISLLWATGRRSKFTSLDQLQAAIKKNRAEGPARPPASLTSRCDVTEEECLGSLVYRVRPKGMATTGTILYIHGGAYVFDLVGPHWTIIQTLAEKTGAEVVVPIYPLAPEATYKQAFAMLDELWVHLTAKSSNVAIAGDSAGGGFTLALAQRVRDSGLTTPAALLLISPWCDVSITDPVSFEVQPHDPMLVIAGCREAGKMWANGADVTSAIISPLYGAMEALPPVAIFTGSSDILVVDARRLRDKLIEAGTAVEYHEYPNMFHVWLGAPIPEARRALDEATKFLCTHVRL